MASALCIQHNEAIMKILLKQNTAPIYIVCVLLAIFLPNRTNAQYTLDEKVSFIYINGTSTMHDWTVSANQMKGTLHANVEEHLLVKINALNMSIPASSLKSGKEAMDKNMHQALKTDQYPEILYQLRNHAIDNRNISTIGECTIAGVCQVIEAKITQKKEGKHIKIDGKIKLKMSDFNIKPPTFLLGAFKTGDEITITFHLMFCENN